MGRDEDRITPNSSNPARERRILEAASRLIARYGYDRTTVAEIAAEAGISKGAVYLHFDSKERLFMALITFELENITEDLLNRMENDPESGTLGSLFGQSMLALAANPLMRALTVRDKRVLGTFINQLRAIPGVDRQMFSPELVQSFQAAGLLRTDLSPGMLLYLLSMFRYGFLTVDDVLPPEAVQPLDEVSRVLPDIIERAFAPPGGGDREAGKQVIGQFIRQARSLLDLMRAQRASPPAKTIE